MLKVSIILENWWLITKLGKICLCKNPAPSILDNAVLWNLTFGCLNRKFKPTLWQPQKHIFSWFYSPILFDLLYWTPCTNTDTWLSLVFCLISYLGTHHGFLSLVTNYFWAHSGLFKFTLIKNHPLINNTVSKGRVKKN